MNQNTNEATNVDQQLPVPEETKAQEVVLSPAILALVGQETSEVTPPKPLEI